MKSIFASYLTIGALAVSLPTSLHAQTSAAWTGSSGNWSDASNWDSNPNVPADETYSVTIGNGGEVTLDLDVTLDNLFLVSANLLNEGTYSIEANTTIGVATFGGSGVTTLGGTTTLGSLEFGDSYYDFWLSRLDINGGAEVVNAGVFHQNAGIDEDTSVGYAGDLTLDADLSGLGSTFRNAGTFFSNVQSDAMAFIVGFNHSEADRFINEGSFIKTGAGVTEVTQALGFENSGLVEVREGELLISGGDNDATTGAFSVASGAKLSFGGDEVTFQAGSSLLGNGAVDIYWGKVTLAEDSLVAVGTLSVGTNGELVLQNGADVTVGTLVVDGGLLNLEADFTFADAILRTGTVGGSGAFTATGNVKINDLIFEGAGLKTLSGTSTLGGDTDFGWSNLRVSGGGTEVVKSGLFNQRSAEAYDGDIVLNTDGLDEGSVFRNKAGATFDSEVGSELTAAIYAEGAPDAANNRFINEGAFVKRGEGITDVQSGVGFINSGTIEVQAGRLQIAEGITGAGEVIVKGGTLDLAYASASSRIKLAGGSLEQKVSAEGSLENKVQVQSALVGGIATTATIVAGQVGATETTLTSAFVTSTTETFSFDEARGSDIFRLTSTEEILFVLELAPLSGGIDTGYLGWLNGDSLWVNAVLGNLEGTNNAAEAQLGFAGSFAEFQAEYGGDLGSYIGAYGFSETGVWAVLNHNSDYAVVIPEPGTWALMLAGAGALVGLRKRRRA